ncbi:MAG: hypothetical protein OXL38_07370, partial [Gammaproteobacteria bacterium]|nr:hypothetical protein [Gammaproteobacteria bacterium]
DFLKEISMLSVYGQELSSFEDVLVPRPVRAILQTADRGVARCGPVTFVFALSTSTSGVPSAWRGAIVDSTPKEPTARSVFRGDALRAETAS